MTNSTSSLLIATSSDLLNPPEKPIKIKDLIKEKWLSQIVPRIFESQEKNKVNLINYILDNFTKLDKKYGLSFHSRNLNAFSLFNYHKKLYNENKTKINVNNDFMTIY